MNATASLVTLAERSLANYVLGGNLLPLNNNAAFIRESTTATVSIVDKDDRVIACGAIAMYSPKQAYCVLGEVNKDFKTHTIWVEEVPSAKKESRTLRITKSAPYIVDHKPPTLFEAVFADHDGRPTLLHLIDALVECSVGKTNFDINKNVTVDLFEGNGGTEEEAVADWRDVNGFVVADKHRFEEVTVDRSHLLCLADPTSEVATEPINKADLFPLLDFDAEVSIYDRTEHVTALIQTPGVNGKMAFRGGQSCGYALICKDRVLVCYADNEDTFRQLISSVAKDMKDDQCKMFVRYGAHETTQRIIENATERKEVTRLHTRSNINGIKWSMIYCSNVGLHIF